MSDRHEKWVRVEPGTVIPAGQPYRVERPLDRDTGVVTATEYTGISEPWTVQNYYDGKVSVLLVDSSWKPPLDLPTEACVIRAKVTSWDHPRILFGHPNPGEPEGMTFCRAIDGLGYKADEILSFEVLWIDDKDAPA